MAGSMNGQTHGWTYGQTHPFMQMQETNAIDVSENDFPTDFAIFTNPLRTSQQTN